MGIFFTPIEIAGIHSERFETVKALVDTGAVYSMMPASLLNSLEITPIESQTFILANGQRVEMEVGLAAVRIDGRFRVTPVVFTDDDAHPILGAVTLEEFSLGIDTAHHRLVPVEAIGIRA